MLTPICSAIRAWRRRQIRLGWVGHVQGVKEIHAYSFGSRAAHLIRFLISWPTVYSSTQGLQFVCAARKHAYLLGERETFFLVLRAGGQIGYARVERLVVLLHIDGIKRLGMLQSFALAAQSISQQCKHSCWLLRQRLLMLLRPQCLLCLLLRRRRIFERYDSQCWLLHQFGGGRRRWNHNTRRLWQRNCCDSCISIETVCQIEILQWTCQSFPEIEQRRITKVVDVCVDGQSGGNLQVLLEQHRDYLAQLILCLWRGSRKMVKAHAFSYQSSVFLPIWNFCVKFTRKICSGLLRNACVITTIR